jgi:hypothetical protein
MARYQTVVTAVIANRPYLMAARWWCSPQLCMKRYDDHSLHRRHCYAANTYDPYSLRLFCRRICLCGCLHYSVRFIRTP